MTAVAHARSTDPWTSHAAAASVGDLRVSQAAVYKVLSVFGPMTDEDLVTCYENFQQQWELPKQSESGIRSRRAELVRGGLVEGTGEKSRISTGRLAQVWRVRPAG